MQINREGMLGVIKKINDIDAELRPIILWLNYHGIATCSCCAGHVERYSHKGKIYGVDGYIRFCESPNLSKVLDLFKMNGFKIENQYGQPAARIIFAERNKKRCDVTSRDISNFWEHIFDELKYKLKSN